MSIQHVPFVLALIRFGSDAQRERACRQKRCSRSGQVVPAAELLLGFVTGLQGCLFPGLHGCFLSWVLLPESASRGLIHSIDPREDIRIVTERNRTQYTNLS